MERTNKEQEDQQVKICRDCGGQIIWREGQNRQGETKFFPFNIPPTLNVTTGDTTYERHRCAEYNERRGSQYKAMSNADKAKGIPCRVCGAPITFSEDQRSPHTGKLIPLELTLERHQHRDPGIVQQAQQAQQPQNKDNKVFEQQGTKPDQREIWGSEEDIHEFF